MYSTLFTITLLTILIGFGIFTFCFLPAAFTIITPIPPLGLNIPSNVHSRSTSTTDTNRNCLVTAPSSIKRVEKQKEQILTIPPKLAFPKVTKKKKKWNKKIYQNYKHQKNYSRFKKRQWKGSGRCIGRAYK
jgi:hypothetical protein